MSTLRVEFPAHAFLRLLPFVSTEETHYYLNGVKIETERCVATDGHRLGVVSTACTVETKDSIFDQPIVRPLKDLVAYAKKAVKLNEDAVIVLHGDDKAQTASFALPLDPANVRGDRAMPGFPSFTDQFLIDGTFPDYFRVFPQSDPAELTPVADAFNPDHIGDFAKTSRARLRGTKMGAAVHILSDCIGAPAWVFTDDADFVGVLMPRRKGCPSVRPSWLSGAPAKAAKPQAAE